MRAGWPGICVVCLIAMLAGCSSSLNEERRLPDFVVAVGPGDGEVVELSDPNSWGDEEVCANISIFELLRPGDFIERWDNATLSVDGRVVKEKPSHQILQYPTTIYDETNIVATEEFDFDDDGLIDEIGLEYEILAEGPSTDILCWPVRLGPGTHVAKLRVWTSAGEEYSHKWTFAIVP